MIGDLPSFSNASHSHTSYGLGDMSNANFHAGTTNSALLGNAVFAAEAQRQVPRQLGQLGNQQVFNGGALIVRPDVQAKVEARRAEIAKQEKPTMSRRLVQVFIADPNENLPLDKSMLYTGSQKLTDATDQELFYEIEIKALLDAHNAFRTTVINKKVKDRTELLEPARIRDLKMVVVDIATF